MLLSLFLVALGGLTCDALPRTGGQQWGTSDKALYVMSNSVSGNDVVAISIKEDGSLFDGRFVSTGGIGGNYVSPTDGHPLVPDALSSQDSIIAVGQVNIPKKQICASADFELVLVCNKCRFQYCFNVQKGDVWA